MIDSHAHYDDKAFDDDRDMLLGSMNENGVSVIINVGDNIESSKRSIALAEKYDFIYACVGIHPEHANTVTDKDYDEIKELSKHEKVVAIGEIGLDYHYEGFSKDKQKELFRRQIRMAHEVGLPVVVHERDACADVLEILKDEDITKTGGLLHCFSGSVETLKIVMDMGMYISLGGIVTFKNAKTAPEAAKYVPPDRLLLETDCPYLAPAPFRGKRNNSIYMYYTAEKIAQLRGISFEELEAATDENARRFYRI